MIILGYFLWRASSFNSGQKSIDQLESRITNVSLCESVQDGTECELLARKRKLNNSQQLVAFLD